MTAPDGGRNVLYEMGRTETPTTLDGMRCELARIARNEAVLVWLKGKAEAAKGAQ